MIRAGIALGAAWLLALGLGMTAALPARADVPAANQQFAGAPVAPATSGSPGNPQVRCPPSCVPSCAGAKCLGGPGSGTAATGADEGENRSLATVILLLLCLVGALYGAVKLLQQRRRSSEARVVRLRERTPGRLPEGEA